MITLKSCPNCTRTLPGNTLHFNRTKGDKLNNLCKWCEEEVDAQVAEKPKKPKKIRASVDATT